MKHLALALIAFLALSLPVRADVYQTGTLTAPGTLVLQTATVADRGTGGSGTVVVTVTGSPTTPAFSIQGSSDLATVAEASATWTSLPAVPVGGGATVTSMSSTGKWAVNVAGQTRVRVNLTAIASGSMMVTMDGGPAPSVFSLTQAPPAPAAAAHTIAGCTVGASSAQCLATATATTFVQVQNTGTTNAIACRWGGAAALNSSTSVQLAVGQGASWGPGTAGIPTGALNCIAAGASSPLYVEYN